MLRQLDRATRGMFNEDVKRGTAMLRSCITELSHDVPAIWQAVFRDHAARQAPHAPGAGAKMKVERSGTPKNQGTTFEQPQEPDFAAYRI